MMETTKQQQQHQHVNCLTFSSASHVGSFSFDGSPGSAAGLPTEGQEETEFSLANSRWYASRAMRISSWVRSMGPLPPPPPPALKK
jgi:hypothetical protein